MKAIKTQNKQLNETVKKLQNKNSEEFTNECHNKENKNTKS